MYYSVLRHVPDPGRNESRNVGVVLWSPAPAYRLADDAPPACDDYLARRFKWFLTDAARFADGFVNCRGFPLYLSGPLYVREDRDGPAATLDSLYARFVAREE